MTITFQAQMLAYSKRFIFAIFLASFTLPSAAQTRWIQIEMEHHAVYYSDHITPNAQNPDWKEVSILADYQRLGSSDIMETTIDCQAQSIRVNRILAYAGNMATDKPTYTGNGFPNAAFHPLDPNLPFGKQLLHAICKP